MKGNTQGAPSEFPPTVDMAVENDRKTQWEGGSPLHLLLHYTLKPERKQKYCNPSRNMKSKIKSNIWKLSDRIKKSRHCHCNELANSFGGGEKEPWTHVHSSGKAAVKLFCGRWLSRKYLLMLTPGVISKCFKVFRWKVLLMSERLKSYWISTWLVGVPLNNKLYIPWQQGTV